MVHKFSPMFRKALIKNSSETDLLNILAVSQDAVLKRMAESKLKRTYGWVD